MQSGNKKNHSTGIVPRRMSLTRRSGGVPSRPAFRLTCILQVVVTRLKLAIAQAARHVS